MKRLCVLVATGARARLLSAERVGRKTPRQWALVEHMTEVNPDHVVPEHTRYSEARSNGRGWAGAGHHGFDDRRGAHDREITRRFAATAACDTAALARELQAEQIVVVADPYMLGLLRTEYHRFGQLASDVVELHADLSKLSLHELRRRLERDGILNGSPGVQASAS